MHSPLARPPTAPANAQFATLIERIRSVETGGLGRSGPLTTVQTGWALAGQRIELARGVLHEWFGVDEPVSEPLVAGSAGLRSMVPLSILLHLASTARIEGKLTVFIGRPCWPSVFALRAKGLLDTALLLDPPGDNERLWAIDLCLRSAAVCAVIADGTGLDMPSSRRLQLAAQRNGGESADGSGVGTPLALLARPTGDLTKLSAAATRWHVCPVPFVGGNGVGVFSVRWRVRMLRSKVSGGVSSAVSGGCGCSAPAGLETGFELECAHAALRVTVAPEMVNRSLQAADRQRQSAG